MLKKMIISVLILALCFAFVSCDSQTADQSTPSTNESTKEESQAEENNNQTEESKNDMVQERLQGLLFLPLLLMRMTVFCLLLLTTQVSSRI